MKPKKKKYNKKIFRYFRNNLIFSLIIISFFALNLNIFAQDSTGVKLQDTIQSPIEQILSTDTSKPKNAPIIAIFPDPTLDPNSIDYKIFTSVNYNRSSFKDFVVPLFDNSMAPMAFIMPVSMFTYGRLTDKTYEENTGYLLAVSLITNTAVTFAAKMLVKRKRVRVYMTRYGIYPKTYTSVDPYSFPSGHTSTSFAIATMFALRYPSYPLVIFPAYAWAVVVGYGRMYLGMHYPSDVLAGAIIGAGSSVLIHSLRKEFFKFKNNLLNEKKNDDGSINGGTASILAVGFLASILFDQIMPSSSNKLIINASPFHNNNPGIDLNMNYKF
jgi:membrane-associated phospholipid phosphatase